MNYCIIKAQLCKVLQGSKAIFPRKCSGSTICVFDSGSVPLCLEVPRQKVLSMIAKVESIQTTQKEKELFVRGLI